VQLVLITTDVVSSNPGRGEEYLIQHYVKTFVSDLRQVGCLLRFPQTNQTDRHDIAEILFWQLKVNYNMLQSVLTTKGQLQHVNISNDNQGQSQRIAISSDN
jgi:multidrug efflux pump subunit AcrB